VGTRRIALAYHTLGLRLEGTISACCLLVLLALTLLSRIPGQLSRRTP
jgi:hypothetical protein